MFVKLDNSAAAMALKAAVAAIGPFCGEYALIVIAALGGSLVALSRAELDQSRRRSQSVTFIFRSVMIASFSTGAAASWISAVTGTGVEWYRLVAFVAFFIALVGDDWFRVKDLLISRWTRGPK